MLNPVTTTTGRYVVASVIDVTWRNQTEEQLAITAAELAEANRLMAMAEQMAKVGYWRFDLRTQEMFWSDEVYRIRGFDRSHQPTLEAVVDALSRMIASGSRDTSSARLLMVFRIPSNHVLSGPTEPCATCSRAARPRPRPTAETSNSSACCKTLPNAKMVNASASSCSSVFLY
jgi:hypothetical protein